MLVFVSLAIVLWSGGETSKCYGLLANEYDIDHLGHLAHVLALS